MAGGNSQLVVIVSHHNEIIIAHSAVITERQELSMNTKLSSHFVRADNSNI